MGNGQLHGQYAMTSNLHHFDVDAQRYFRVLFSEGIQLRPEERYGVNEFIRKAKEAGLWQKIKAVYFMVGANFNAFKYNGKDPRNADNAFRLSVISSTGISYTSSGLEFAGSGYINTFFTPLTDTNNISNHISMYINSFTSSNVQMGAEGGSSGTLMARNYPALGDISRCNCGFGGAQTARSRNVGFSCTSRINLAEFKVYEEGSVLNTYARVGLSGSNVPIWINGYNLSGSISDGSGTFKTQFISIGDGLSDRESFYLYRFTQDLQKTLGRNV
jgi:hypothetical protein